MVPDVFTRSECIELIERTEAKGYVEATMSIAGGGSVSRPDIRDNYRCVLTDLELVSKLWMRLKPHLPATYQGRACLRLNEYARFYRYETGQSFAKHMDDAVTTEAGETSLLTVLLYLSDGFQGGATRLATFEEPDTRALDVVPKAGGVLIFDHKVLHVGMMQTGGDAKYVMRSDVLFSICESAHNVV